MAEDVKKAIYSLYIFYFSRIGQTPIHVSARDKREEIYLMNRMRICRGLLTGAFVLAAAGFALANEVVINNQAKLGSGPELRPGTYRLKLIKNHDTSEVAFYKSGNLVIQVPVVTVAETEKSPRTEVHYETLDQAKVISQIRIAGWKETLVFKAQSNTPAAE